MIEVGVVLMLMGAGASAAHPSWRLWTMSAQRRAELLADVEALRALPMPVPDTSIEQLLHELDQYPAVDLSKLR